MSTENLEQPIEQQEPKPARSYNPFISPVNEKPYSQMNVNVDQQRMYAPIPEASVSGNVVDGNENAYNMLNGEMGGGMSGGSASGGSGQSFNPTMNELSDKDKQEGAAHLAKLMVDGYEQLHVFGNKALQISQKKLQALEAEGEIDLSVQVPFEYGKTIPAGELIQEVNEQNKDILTVSKEFKKEVTPLLTKILAKRGAGLTDEQKLTYLVVKDLAVKGIIIYQVRNTTNELINVIKDYTAAYKGGGSTTPTPPPPPPPPTEPAPQKPKPPKFPVERQGERIYEESFNFDTNEVVVESAVQRHAVPESGKARLMAQKRREKEIEEAMKRAEKMQNPNAVSYAEAMASKKTGKRGRKPKDYVKAINEAEIADAIVLSETKNSESELNED